MAARFENAEFWLPSQFLGPLDADDDEDGLIAYLAQNMTSSDLEGYFKIADYSKVRSPQTTMFGDGWGGLYEAAGGLAGVSLAEQLSGIRCSRGGGDAMHRTAPGRFFFPVPTPEKIDSPSFSYRQLVENQIQLLKRLRQLQHRPPVIWGTEKKPNSAQYQAISPCRRRPDFSIVCRNERQLFATPAGSAWPMAQIPKGPGVRAVLLGSPPLGRGECAGTGVFLPRGAGSVPGPRKKPAFSAVVPGKVVGSMNPNLENVISQPHILCHNNGRLATNNGRNSVAASQQNFNGIQQLMNPEISLPQEWTY
ncbi:hypothetical protein SAY87_008384 [Trapa incisa]|uniref:Uncharacterized protein n=1 Tax=Trapa incisa TaxID=236973 RepID=A0AAN7QG04_9MYRT|nr:hypothetical protein SAY87_008384 [Trapa incisa]